MITENPANQAQIKTFFRSLLEISESRLNRFDDPAKLPSTPSRTDGS